MSRIFQGNIVDLVKAGEVQSADARNLELIGFQMPSLLFKDSNLQGFRFKKCKFETISFKYCNVYGVTFEDCEIKEMELVGDIIYPGFIAFGKTILVHKRHKHNICGAPLFKKSEVSLKERPKCTNGHIRIPVFETGIGLVQY